MCGGVFGVALSCSGNVMLRPLVDARLTVTIYFVLSPITSKILTLCKERICPFMLSTLTLFVLTGRSRYY